MIVDRTRRSNPEIMGVAARPEITAGAVHMQGANRIKEAGGLGKQERRD